MLNKINWKPKNGEIVRMWNNAFACMMNYAWVFHVCWHYPFFQTEIQLMSHTHTTEEVSHNDLHMQCSHGKLYILVNSTIFSSEKFWSTLRGETQIVKSFSPLLFWSARTQWWPEQHSHGGFTPGRRLEFCEPGEMCWLNISD